MHGGQVSQARRKFHVGSGLQPTSLIGVQPRSLDSCPLTRDPVQMPEPERRGFSARAAPWNGDSYATVAIHTFTPTEMSNAVPPPGRVGAGEHLLLL